MYVPKWFVVCEDGELCSNQYVTKFDSLTVIAQYNASSSSVMLLLFCIFFSLFRSPRLVIRTLQLYHPDAVTARHLTLGHRHLG